MSSSENLELLLRGYFNQDWKLGHSDFRSVVREFCSDHSADELRVTIDQISKLLASNGDEQSFEALLDRTGAAITPSRLGMTARQWFQAVLDETIEGLARCEKATNAAL